MKNTFWIWVFVIVFNGGFAQQSDYNCNKIYDKHNFYVRKMNAGLPDDTVKAYLIEAFNFNIYSECNDFFNEDIIYTIEGIWKKQNRSLHYLKEIKCRCDSAHKRLDSTLIKVIQQMFDFDQMYRNNNEDAPWKKGNEEKWQKQHLVDSINGLLLAKILDTKGYPGNNIVGYHVKDLAAEIIQHQPLQYREKYMNLLISAAAKGQVSDYWVAMIQDRNSMENGVPQKYGTQLIFNKNKNQLELYKVENLAELGAIRKSVCLSPIEYYLKQNNAVMYDAANK